MSLHYSKYMLNTYAETPYFQAHIPEDYPIDRVLMKSRAFYRLPPHIKELAAKAKEWARKNKFYTLDIDQWYDSEGRELDPNTKSLMTDEEIDSQWSRYNDESDSFEIKDIPIPDGGFADPNTWQPPEPEKKQRKRPPDDHLLAAIASHGRKRTAEEYGIPENELPGLPDESDDGASLAIAPPPLSAAPLTVNVYMTNRPVGTITQKGVGFFLNPKGSEILQKILKNPITIHIGGIERQLYATEDPVLFIKHLVFHYKSHQGLMVSKAEESGAPLSLEE
jgi:hypothetical protein